jgi:hypothetical protein
MPGPVLAVDLPDVGGRDVGHALRVYSQFFLLKVRYSTPAMVRMSPLLSA